MKNEDRIMVELTTTQRQTLSAWLSAHDREFAIELARVLAEEKPAIELRMPPINSGPFLTAERAVAFVRELGLAASKRDGRHFIAHTHDWIDEQLPSGSLPNAEHNRQMGYFFGYPEADVEWFINTPQDERVSPRERVESGDFTPEEMAHTDFLSYVPEDSIEGYERAIANGKRARERLSDVADEADIPVIKEIAEAHYQSAVDVYAGERNPGDFGFKMITTNPNLD